MERGGDGMRGLALVRDGTRQRGLRGEVCGADRRQDAHLDAATPIQLVGATKDQRHDLRIGAQAEVADARCQRPRLTRRHGRTTLWEEREDGAGHQRQNK